MLRGEVRISPATPRNQHNDQPDKGAKGKDSLKRDKYSQTGTGACRLVPLSHETFGRAGPAAFALLNEIAEFAAGSGVVSKRLLLENVMRDLTTTLWRGIPPA